MPEVLPPVLTTLAALPVRGLLLLVRLYQVVVSPVLPAVFGPACGCRFHPTCSHYAMEALRTHGAMRGAWLSLRRLLKCTPLHPGGFDAVPPRRAASARQLDSGPRRGAPTCVRLHRPTLSPNG